MAELKTVSTQKKQNTMLMNPLIRKLSKIEEYSPDNAATYKGVAAKTCFFMAWAIIGVIAFFAFRPMLEIGEPILINETYIYIWEAAVAGLALLLSIIAPLIAFIIRPLVPIVGSIYCLCFAYGFTWIANVFSTEYGALITAAVGITILLVALMAILYTTGIVKVGHKFRTVVTALFLTTVLSGVAGALLSLIPALHDFISAIMNNAVMCIVGGIIYIIIACLFLLVDFDTIQKTVERQLPKKYEWIAAFGLAYTIFYLFLKIFNLLVSAKNNE